MQRFANLLKKHGVKKGDRVCIYLQMIPEMVHAVLACARIGAVHNVVFGGFSTDSLVDRIHDSSSKLIITQDQGVRGAKYDIPMFKNSFDCLERCDSLEGILVVERTGDASIVESVKAHPKCHSVKEELSSVGDECPCEEMDSEDPLFIL